jgi:predicted  nucleic acid-binding Zn-ribbon protein
VGRYSYVRHTVGATSKPRPVTQRKVANDDTLMHQSSIKESHCNRLCSRFSCQQRIDLLGMQWHMFCCYLPAFNNDFLAAMLHMFSYLTTSLIRINLQSLKHRNSTSTPSQVQVQLQPKTLRDRWDAAHAQLAEIHWSQMAAAKEQESHLQAQLAASDKQRDGAHAQLADAKSQLEAATKMVSTLQSRLAASDRQKEEADVQLAVVSSQLGTAREEAAQLLDRLASTEQQLAEERARAAELAQATAIHEVIHEEWQAAANKWAQELEVRAGCLLLSCLGASSLLWHCATNMRYHLLCTSGGHAGKQRPPLAIGIVRSLHNALYKPIVMRSSQLVKCNCCALV